MTFGILHLRREKCLDIMAMTTDEFFKFFLNSVAELQMCV